MRAMAAAFLAIAVIAVGANWILTHSGYTELERTSPASVRLD